MCLIAPCVSSYRWVQFPRSVLFCLPHQHPFLMCLSQDNQSIFRPVWRQSKQSANIPASVKTNIQDSIYSGHCEDTQQRQPVHIQANMKAVKTVTIPASVKTKSQENQSVFRPAWRHTVKTVSLYSGRCEDTQSSQVSQYSGQCEDTVKTISLYSGQCEDTLSRQSVFRPVWRQAVNTDSQDSQSIFRPVWRQAVNTDSQDSQSLFRPVWRQAVNTYSQDSQSLLRPVWRQTVNTVKTVSHYSCQCEDK